MNGNKYITTTEYAKKHGLSRMHVNRLIRTGKLPATRVGKVWMIFGEGEQRGFEKTTSLQKWNKLIEETLHKKMKIEELSAEIREAIKFQQESFQRIEEFEAKGIQHDLIKYTKMICKNTTEREILKIQEIYLEKIEKEYLKSNKK